MLLRLMAGTFLKEVHMDSISLVAPYWVLNECPFARSEEKYVTGSAERDIQRANASTFGMPIPQLSTFCRPEVAVIFTSSQGDDWYTASLAVTNIFFSGVGGSTHPCAKTLRTQKHPQIPSAVWSERLHYPGTMITNWKASFENREGNDMIAGLHLGPSTVTQWSNRRHSQRTSLLSRTDRQILCLQEAKRKLENLRGEAQQEHLGNVRYQGDRIAEMTSSDYGSQSYFQHFMWEPASYMTLSMEELTAVTKIMQDLWVSKPPNHRAETIYAFGERLEMAMERGHAAL